MVRDLTCATASHGTPIVPRQTCDPLRSPPEGERERERERDREREREREREGERAAVFFSVPTEIGCKRGTGSSVRMQSVVHGGECVCRI
jgi:hypothetical protein